MAELDDEEAKELLLAARGGDADALATLIGRCQGILNAQARRELDSRLQVRASMSDVYQQTCLSAVKQMPAFQGTTMPEFIAWLKALQRHNLLDIARDNKAGKRDINKERPDDGSNDMPRELPDRQSATPSEIFRADEELCAIHQAIAGLPDRQRQVVSLRLLDKHPFKTIADQLQSTEDAVAGLYKRGLENLRGKMGSIG